MKTVMERLWYLCHTSPYVRWQLAFAQTTLAAENTALLLLDEEGENLVFAASTGHMAEKYVGGGEYDSALRVTMSAGIGMNPLAVLYSKPMSMEKPDPRHNPTIDQAVGTYTRSLYTIPIACSDRTVGTMSTINVHQNDMGGAADRFSPADMEALQTAAEAVSFWITREWGRLASESQSLLAD